MLSTLIRGYIQNTKKIIFTYKFAFDSIEFIGFILPAIPDSIYVRFAILFVYFIGHYYKFQYIYAKYKNNLINA